MGTNNKNKKTEDGWLLRPIAGPTDLSTSTKLGPTEEEVLIERYSALSDWLSEVKALEKRGRIELNSYLKTAMAKAKTDGRVRDCSHETALRLGGTHTGPDLLLFFVRKCPHYRDAFLRGELPPYPWRISQPFEKEQKPAGTGQKEIVEVKPSVFGITVDIKELARRFWKWVCSRNKD